MIPKTPAIRMVPLDAITVLNPRARNKKIFQELVTSIKNLGLKKPITVAERPDKSGYDLVCGQGRMEAFVALGQTQIPAVVVEASQEDCFVMSLVENLARRQHSPLDLLKEIGALRARGYSVTEIAKKTDFSDEYVSAICYLLDHGEERLLVGVERGVIPPSIAMEISRAKDASVQQALTEAYENKAIPGNQVIAIRRIIDQRNAIGKGMSRVGLKAQARGRKVVTADSLVRAYRKEVDRQRLLVKKATVTQSRLMFVVNGLRRLLTDEHFVTLLRAEGMTTMPRPIAQRIGTPQE
jgi:ParB family transcriptional regulator, chromosome partitioning protein